MNIRIPYQRLLIREQTSSLGFLRAPALLFLYGLMTMPGIATAAVSAEGSGDNGSIPVLLVVVLIAILVAALAIFGLIYWSRKEDHLGEMVHFCLKFLIHSEDVSERCASARALGKANDPGALLVLLDVILDDDELETVRKAASEALHEMGTNLRKHKEVITDLELAAEQRDFQKIITILTANFEHGRKKYAQCAYLIARQYMRLDHYASARDWLIKAEFRNRRFNLYGNQISKWIELCNIHLLEEADNFYKEGHFEHAKERYAVLDHDLSITDKLKTSVYLRTACVYVKLRDYRNADQSLLLALAQNQETEMALTLAPLLQEVQKANSAASATSDKSDSIHKLINLRADEIMGSLLNRKL